MDIGFVIDAAIAGLGVGLFLLCLGISGLIYWIALDKYAEWEQELNIREAEIREKEHQLNGVE